MTILIIVLCVLALVLLIVWAKINPFIAFLLISFAGGLALGIPVTEISRSVQKGIGDLLGSLIIIICAGAMIGKLVAESGASQKIATVMMNLSGTRYIQWALVGTGFIIGIPLFYNVGFVLVVPLIFSVSYRYKLPAVYIGLPMLTALSVTHGLLPPHPAPAALVVQFNAHMGKTLLYGMLIAIPTVILAGPIFSRTLKNIVSHPLDMFTPKELPEEQLPGAVNSFVSALLPVFLLLFTSFIPFVFTENKTLTSIAAFVGDPSIVMLIALVICTLTLGTAMGRKIGDVMETYASAIRDIAMILLILAGAGALKQVLLDSGASDQIIRVFDGLPVHPLLLGWLIAAIIRVLIGSATIAGLTTAGIIYPLLVSSGVDPNLMVLSIGAGSLMFSHVNDPGFWMFKEYFNLNFRDTIRSWSLMETIISVCGIVFVMVLNRIIH
jgi:Gnt-I system high-affinity gluconate transporter